MITPDWNKNLSKEKLPLVSSLQIVTAFCSDLNSWRYAGFDESFCISQNILIVLMEVWQWPAVCSISSQLFLLELGEGQGTRDTPAICRFLKSLSAQFSKPFFSKPIFINHSDDSTVLVFTYRGTCLYAGAVDVSGCDYRNIFSI